MKTFLIAYNLVNVSKTQIDSLTNKIRSLQYWAKPLAAVWLIKTQYSKEAVINYLKPELYAGDKIVVIEVTNDWISMNLDKEVVEWMKGGL